MRNIRSLIALGALALSPVVLTAQGTQGAFKWAGTGSSFAWYWNGPTGIEHVMGGGPYSAQFQLPAGGTVPTPPHASPVGGTAWGPAVDIYCIDFVHNANTSSSGYSAYFTNLGGGTGQSLSNTRSTDLSRYLKAAWLTTQFNTTTSQATKAEIHAAIWWVMGQPMTMASWKGTGSAGDLSQYQVISGTETWVTAANTAYNANTWHSVVASDWSVVTDVCVKNKGDNTKGELYDPSNCSQEFLVHNQNVVPEPATLLLLGTGLLATLAMAGVLRRPEA